MDICCKPVCSTPVCFSILSRPVSQSPSALAALLQADVPHAAVVARTQQHKGKAADLRVVFALSVKLSEPMTYDRQSWEELEERPSDQVVTSAQEQQYAAQYQQLKKEMLGRTQRFAGLLAAYLFLTVSSEVPTNLQSVQAMLPCVALRTVASKHHIYDSMTQQHVHHDLVVPGKLLVYSSQPSQWQRLCLKVHLKPDSCVCPCRQRCVPC